MYDYIKVEYPLNNLPQQLVDLWKGDVTFQTKDTPDQYMSLYKIDADGQLWYEKRKTEWVDPVNPESESISERLGHINTVSKTWNQIDFTGDITFYDSYKHKNYKLEYNTDTWENWQRYESGWVEYTALFKDGQMIDINLVQHDEPRELTDEELEAKRKKWAALRAISKAQVTKIRKENPSPAQKLIDQIYNTTTEAIKYELYEQGAESILSQIKDYREKVDIWYTDEN